MSDEKKYVNCATCGTLKDRENGFEKRGWPEQTVRLPDAYNKLRTTHFNGRLGLMECKECGTFYEYYTRYDYYVNGEEDEETLERITDERAAELRQTLENFARGDK
jgi:hypothetical protein